MIIGSNAIKYWFSDFSREPKDIDIVTSNEYNKQDLLKIHKDIKHLKVEILKNPILVDWCKSENNLPIYCPKDELYTLKISHSLWDLENNSWEKHLWDIQWLKEKKCNFIPELFYKLYKYWETIHGKRKTSKLDMSSEDFFDNAIKYHIPHDTMHELLIKHPYFNQSEPTYKLVLKDNAEVDVDENKFNKLTELQKFNLVFEEVAVMAEERYNIYYKRAYNRMLKKFILNHAPIWEAIWIIQNHKELLCNIPFDFKQYFKTIKQ